MLSIDHFADAILAEGVAAFSNVGVVEGLEADDALSKLTDDVINADLDSLVVFRLALLEARKGLNG